MPAAQPDASPAASVTDQTLAAVRSPPLHAAGQTRGVDSVAAIYRRVLQRWAPFALGTFETWTPGAAVDTVQAAHGECGHFFTGSYWYGNDTAHPALVLAVLARTTPDDAAVAAAGHASAAGAARAAEYADAAEHVKAAAHASAAEHVRAAEHADAAAHAKAAEHADAAGHAEAAEHANAAGHAGPAGPAALAATAVRAIRYLCLTHDSGPADCVRPPGPNPHTSGRKWGGAGDRHFRALMHGVPVTALGVAAWLLWDQLEADLRRRVAVIVAGYAQRWSGEEPRAGTYYDTQSEENACVGMGIALAACMLAADPRAAEWQRASSRWLMNCCTVPDDRYCETLVDGRPVRDWATTITTHPDFSVENHGFVHPNYLGAKVALGGMAMLWHLLAGDEPPQATRYHTADIYRVLARLHDTDGQYHFVQSQDWWYTRYSDAAFLHAVMNVCAGDGDAALLERRALGYVQALQERNRSGALFAERGLDLRITEFQTAWSFEPQSAGRFALGYLLHLLGAGCQPSDAADFERRQHGVWQFPHGGFVARQGDGVFSSSSWRNTVMHITAPRAGKWLVTPLPASYTGYFALADAADGGRFDPGHREPLTASAHDCRTWADGYATAARIDRCAGRVAQHTAFVALPGGATVYLEWTQAQAEVRLATIYGCPIGIRNETVPALGGQAGGTRRIITAAGEQRAPGARLGIDAATDAADTWLELGTERWLNVDDQLGLVVIGSAGVSYWNRRSFPKWKGIEDVLFLNLDRTGHTAQPRVAVAGDTLTRLVVLTAPNADAAATRQQADALVAADCDPPFQAMAVLMPEALVVAHFTPAAATVRVSVSLADREIPLLPGTQTITAAQDAPVAGCAVRYVVDIDGRPVPTTSVVHPVARLTADAGALDLCIDVPNRRRLLITNRSSRAATCTLRTVDTERRHRFDLASRQTLPIDLLMLSA